MKVPAPLAPPHRNGYPGRDGEKIDGDHPPQNGFDEATNVMESGLLRTLTDESARESGQGDAEIVADAPAAKRATPDDVAPPEGETSPSAAPQSTPHSAAPPRRRSRVFVIAGTVAAIVLAFDAWLITHHRRPTRPFAAAPSAPSAPPAPSNALPTYSLLPLGTPPPDPAQRNMPAVAPTNRPLVEEAAPATAVPTPHRHRHGHHRH